MALIDIVCHECLTVSEVYRSIQDWPATPPCPKCDSLRTEQKHLPSYERSSAPAVVVFKAQDGSLRFPGDPNGLSAKNYEKLGYTREEYRGWAEVRKLETLVNKHEGSKIREHVEKEQAFREESTKRRRSEVFNGMANGFQIPEVNEKGERTGRMRTVRMSEQGKDILRAVIARQDGKPVVRAGDPGFRVEAFSETRSNRDEGRRSDGHRFRD